jgi:hypothetical protein
VWIAARKGLGALSATRASDLAYVEQGHVALPPSGSKRLGPQYWAGDSSDWLILEHRR